MTKKLLSFLAMAILCITSLIAQEEPQERTFRVVTYNVDGLPAQTPLLNMNITNSNSPGPEGSEEMGRRIKALNPDLIAVQEDFDFNGSFSTGLGNEYSQGWWRGAFSWSSINNLHLNTDGLNLFWKEETMPVVKGSESCTEFNDRYGRLILEGGPDSGFDWYIAKGFRYSRAKVKDISGRDASIDIFFTHMDAGSSEGDINAKNSQLTQMTNQILNTGNRPKIVMGDFNSRYTREKIYDNFIKPLEDAGFEVHDAWIDTYRKDLDPQRPPYGENAWDTGDVNSAGREIVDKIFYINPTSADGIKLELNYFHIEEGFTDDYMSTNTPTEHIGDHDPVIADFKVVGTQKTVDISSQWVWKGEEKQSNGSYYILNYQNNTFIQPGSEKTLNLDVEKADLIKLVGNNEPYLLKKDNGNGNYITWGGRGDYALDVNRETPYSGLFSGDAKDYFYENTNFPNGSRDPLDLYYIIYFDGTGSKSYLEVDGTGETAELTKHVDTDALWWTSNPSDHKDDKHYNWKLISEPQKQTYLAYKAALEKALEYVTTYIASDKSVEQKLMAELDNKEQRWWYQDKVTEFIEFVAGLDFANLTINKNAVDELNPDPYGTFVAPYPVKLPASVNAYVIEADNESNIINLTTKYENESTIPKCTPVLLVSKKPEGQSTIMYYGQCATDVCEPKFTYSTGTLSYVDGVEFNDTKNKVTHHNKMYTCKAGDLEGSFVYQNLPDASNGENFYLLQKQNVDGKDKVAFYLCKTPHSLYTTGKNRCWLVKSGDTGNGTIGTQAKQAFYFQLWDDDADAITKVETEDNMHKTVIYDLSGRRVTNPQRGIYIMNGKKVYINK